MFKGRPFLGVISGFFFGLFLGPTLWLWGVIPFHSPLMWILPLVGIVLGLIVAAWAPFGRGPNPAAASSSSVGYASAGDADPYQTSGTTLEQEAVEPPETDGDT
jgi:hypothetical protein